MSTRTEHKALVALFVEQYLAKHLDLYGDVDPILVEALHSEGDHMMYAGQLRRCPDKYTNWILSDHTGEIQVLCTFGEED